MEGKTLQIVKADTEKQTCEDCFFNLFCKEQVGHGFRHPQFPCNEVDKKVQYIFVLS